MVDYDSALFVPPGPLARIFLRHPETGLTVENIPMLLDTGADATLIPRSGVGIDWSRYSQSPSNPF
jgi:hypothetical protein